MKAGWRDAPLALRDSVLSNMHVYIYLYLYLYIHTYIYIYINFLDCYMTSRWSRDQISTLIMVSQHVAYIDDHGPSASEDIGGNLICHATSQDHLIEGVIRIYG